MAVLEAAALSSFSVSSSTKSPFSYKQPPSFIKLHTSTYALSVSHNADNRTTRRLCFALRSTAQEEATTAVLEETEDQFLKRKLFVSNLPWTFNVVEMKELFSQCGTVEDIEVIKDKDGKKRGFAFVTMASGEESQAVLEKFDSHELSGRIIRVEIAKRFKKPSRPPPEVVVSKETRYKLYVSNLAWKARSTHLREFFSGGEFNPASARVVFAAPSGRSSGYGFVSFLTKEEAEAAISALDGKELLGRPISLKFSENKADESMSETEAETGVETETETGTDSSPEDQVQLEG